MVREPIGDRLLLVGTAHVSPESVAEVQAAIEEFRPDVVAVELDALRLEALEDKRRWENTPFHKILRSDKLWLFLTQVLLSSYQRRLGEEYGSEPGMEMLAAVHAARAQGKEVLLADRDVGVTMRRAYRLMTLREKLRLSWELLKGLVGGDDGEAEAIPIQDLLQEDVITRMMNELGQMAPSIKRVVVDERDTYLAARLAAPLAEGRRVLGVVGAGHLPGIRDRLVRAEPSPDLKALEVIPPKRVNVSKILGWSFPVLLIALFGYFGYKGIQEGNWDELRRFLLDLLLWGGGLAALGCLLARGHPLSIVTAFLVAPITILHPGLAAGWFSGLVEAWIREPRVLDFRKLSRIDSMRVFFNNRVIRVLVVAALTNVGAMIGASIVIGRDLTNIFQSFVALGNFLAGLLPRALAGDVRSLVVLVGIAALLLFWVARSLRRRR